MPFLLADCNNFFASCERVFDASLHNRPLVILSNNDGCVISRSQEAKDIGVPMGVPAHECRDLFREHNVALRSANFPLYGDMSQRVMKTLNEFNAAAEVEEYSIDEAFLSLPHTPRWADEGTALAEEASRKIFKWTGIPVSIGVASTKTLAKLSNSEAKRLKRGTVAAYCLEAQPNLDAILSTIPVGKVWGIGGRLTARLHDRGIDTVLDLKRAEPKWILKHLSVTSLRTQRELNGEPCLEFDEVTLRHTVLSSRSFGQDITAMEPLREAIATFTSRASEKLRQHGRAAGVVQVFLRLRRPYEIYDDNEAPIAGIPYSQASGSKEYIETAVLAGPLGGWYSGKGKGTSESAVATLPVATSFTPHLVAAAHRALARVYRPGVAYAKGGVLLAGLCPQDAVQLSLFERVPNPEPELAVMHAMDRLNRKYGERTLYILGSGVEKGPARNRNWMGRRQHCSPRYTTCLSELFTVGDLPGDRKMK